MMSPRRKLRLVGVDYETYYDTEYSLRRMPTPLYVRDPRFQAFGAAVKIDDKPAKWLDEKPLRKFFDLINWDEVIFYGHNLLFDGFITSDVYGKVPALYLDSLGVCRAVIGNKLRNRGLDAVGKYLGIGGKLDGGRALSNMRGVRHPTPEQLFNLAMYACDDLEKTYTILQRLLPEYPKGEIKVQDWVTRMMCEPTLELDEALLEEIYVDEVTRKQKLLVALNLDRKQINSNPQFAALLEARGVTPPRKISKTTGKETYAFAKTDQEFVELQECADPTISALVQARLGVKSSIEETRAKHFLDLSRTDGAFPVPLKYSGTHTHRLSGDAGLNVQNLGRASRLRKAIRAPKGHVCVVADSSQIQLRVGAAVAGQWDLLNDLKNGKDSYGKFGSKLFNCRVSKKENVEKRTIAKIGVLQCQFGSGPPRFKAAVWSETSKIGVPMTITLDEAKKIVYGFRREFQAYPQVWEALTEKFKEMASGMCPTNLDTNPPIEWDHDRIIGPSGLALMYPNLREQYNEAEHRQGLVYDIGESPTMTHGGMLLQNLAIFLEREIMTYHTKLINPHYPVKLQVHDELVMVVPEKEAEACSAFVRTTMSTPPPWWPDFPVACDVDYAPVYGDAK